MREKVAIKSSVIGLTTQVLTMILSMACTRVFVHELGLEIVGINGLLSNCLNMLQLAEMGIGTAIIYELYQPLVDNKITEIQILMYLYKKIYFFIGAVILILGIGMSFFLDFFITDATYAMSYIRIIFYIQLLASVSSYIFAYKRNLLYADQKQYINIIIDTTFNILVTIIKIAVLLVWKSYVLYLILQIIQILLSNIIISIWCDRHYPYLKEKTNDKYEKMPQLISNVKDLMIGKIGGFVYGSTDNLVISKFVGIAAVGYMSNYYQVSTVLKTLSASITQPIQPMIGNYIREYNDEKKSYELFLAYTFIRYCIANIITVGFATMCNPFISLWLGDEYILHFSIPLLIAFDTFVSVLHGPMVEFIAVLGLFKNDRNFSIIGMLINLIASILLTKWFGIAGVLMGTAIAQIYYWCARGKVVFDIYFRRSSLLYWVKSTMYILVTIIDIVILHLIQKYFIEKITPLNFAVMCIVSVLVTAASSLICFAKTDEFLYVIAMIKRVRKKK